MPVDVAPQSAELGTSQARASLAGITRPADRVDWLAALAARSDVRLAALKVAIALTARCNSSTGRLDPSVTTLAAATGLDVRSVRRALCELAAIEAISIERSAGGSIAATNRYRLEPLAKPPLTSESPVTGASPLTSESPVTGESATPDSPVRLPLTGESPKHRNRTQEGTQEAKPTVPPCPHREIVDLYHELLPELPRVLFARWHGSARARMLQARWREDERHQNLEFWHWFFTAVGADPFYLGAGNRGWRAYLGWLLKRENFDKVVECAADERPSVGA